MGSPDLHLQGVHPEGPPPTQWSWGEGLEPEWLVGREMAASPPGQGCPGGNKSWVSVRQKKKKVGITVACGPPKPNPDKTLLLDFRYGLNHAPQRAIAPSVTVFGEGFQEGIKIKGGYEGGALIR